MNKEYRRNSFNKGSITVESAFVVGLALFVIFTVLALCFYMHNKAYYVAAAGETAITAATYATRQEGDFRSIIDDKLKDFVDGAKYPDISRGLISQSSNEKMLIGIKAKVPLYINSQSFQMEVAISSKVIRPVKFIRVVQSLQMVKEQLDAS